MITQVVIGRGNSRKVATIPATFARDVNRELRKDAANALKDYLFGPLHLRRQAEQPNRQRKQKRVRRVAVERTA